MWSIMTVVGLQLPTYQYHQTRNAKKDEIFPEDINIKAQSQSSIEKRLGRYGP